ncbi:MAG: stage II sporulation protein P [Firmicutes bacterium]|nr:stage II sporulation protein P [Bacillota bacterium]NLL87473.1 stage II sporulation protein P [Bacillota bacterium]HKM17644.1 stage II sporulation protein P [Limnochordia bacterium]
MKHKLVLMTFLIFVFVFGAGSSAKASWLDSGLYERNDGGYFTIQDSQGEVITYAARILDRGDSYIAADNQRYEVVAVVDDLITVERKETIELPDVGSLTASAAAPSFWQRLFQTAARKAGNNEQWNAIGIYHTHNAESYVPTSGVESKTEGDIMAVGKALANALENLGYKTFWSDNSHLPHDGEAYVRSRRTAMELMKHQPGTLIDVHRDATPPEVYETEIEGKMATKVRIVVGRQNENRDMNLEYAMRIKAVADEKYPGIIEGIFDARGDYNQDLGPRMILLEFGAHTNPLELAEQAAQFFAEIIPAAAGLSSPGTARQEAQQSGPVAWRSIAWIVMIAVGAIIGYLAINKQGVKSLTSFFRREYAGENREQDQEE